MRTDELMLFKHMEYGSILYDMSFLIENYKKEACEKQELRKNLFDVINRLIELAGSHGFEGNLWQTYLTFLLANDENAYSTACEMVGEIEGSIQLIAMHDLAIFRELFAYDFTELEQGLGVNCFSMLMDYNAAHGHGKVFNQRIRDHICSLSKQLADCESVEEFQDVLTGFIKSLE